MQLNLPKDATEIETQYSQVIEAEPHGIITPYIAWGGY
jgi:hypothetical protein